MNKEPVRIGRIPISIQKLLKVDFGENIFVYLLEKELIKFTTRWPSSYLEKINECALIIKKPLYVGYDKEKNLLYLIRSYLVNNSQIKHVLLTLSSIP